VTTMAAPSVMLTPVESALLVEKTLREAPYEGVDPVVEAAGHPDALASVAAVLAARGVRWGGYAASWSIHGLGEISYKDDHEPARSPEDLPASTAVLSLDVPGYTTGPALRSIVSSAVSALRAHLDDEGVYLADVVVVATHRPEGA